MGVVGHKSSGTSAAQGSLGDVATVMPNPLGRLLHVLDFHSHRQKYADKEEEGAGDLPLQSGANSSCSGCWRHFVAIVFVGVDVMLLIQQAILILVVIVLFVLLTTSLHKTMVNGIHEMMTLEVAPSHAVRHIVNYFGRHGVGVIVVFVAVVVVPVAGHAC